jgi:hypothetical protein
MDNIQIVTKIWALKDFYGGESISIEGCRVTSGQGNIVIDKHEHHEMKFVLESIDNFVLAPCASETIFNYIFCIGGHDYIEVRPLAEGGGPPLFYIYKNQVKVAEVIGYSLLTDSLTSILRTTIQDKAK